jgi:hypothetical protein
LGTPEDETIREEFFEELDHFFGHDRSLLLGRVCIVVVGVVRVTEPSGTEGQLVTVVID